MSHVEFTHDLRRKAGDTNTATELTDNLADVSTAATVLDYVNVTKWSLSQEHIDPGVPATPLRSMAEDLTASYTVLANNTWEVLCTVPVSTHQNAAAVLLVGFASTAATASGDTHELRIREGAATTLTTNQIGEGATASEGVTAHESVATPSAKSYTLEVRVVTAAALPVVTDARLVALVVNR